MLAQSSAMPTRSGHAYEPKLDGFRCLIRTEDVFEARSRRFWNELLDRVTLRRHPRIAELDHEPGAFEAMPVRRPGTHRPRS
jgi:hypothetical protein